MIRKKILYFIPVLLWILCYFVFSFDGLYGQDAYEYTRYSEVLKNYLITGEKPGDYFWGLYYPILGSILSFVIPNIALALQLISLASLLICTHYVEKIIFIVTKDTSFQNIPFLEEQAWELGYLWMDYITSWNDVITKELEKREWVLDHKSCVPWRLNPIIEGYFCDITYLSEKPLDNNLIVHRSYSDHGRIGSL